MIAAPIAERLSVFPKHLLYSVGGMLVLAVLWHACLPGFYYRNSGVFITGPLPAILGAAAALWLARNEEPVCQLLAACAGALGAILLSILVLGSLVFGLWAAIVGLWIELRSCLHFPFTALVSLWGDVHFVYGLLVRAAAGDRARHPRLLAPLLSLG